jgi:3-hydroxyisobutyrate dehydrogenase
MHVFYVLRKLYMARTNPKTYEASTPTKVAFIGLGVMGYPMAGHLALAGHHVTVYNRNPAKAKDWCAEFAGKPVRPRHAKPQKAQTWFFAV